MLWSDVDIGELTRFMVTGEIITARKFKPRTNTKTKLPRIRIRPPRLLSNELLSEKQEKLIKPPGDVDSLCTKIVQISRTKIWNMQENTEKS